MSLEDVTGDTPGTPLERRESELADAAALERRRLADALHDDALQHLLVARQELMEVQGGDETALEPAAAALADGVAALRDLMVSMRASTVGELPLEEAVERLAAEAGRRGSGLAVAVSVGPGIAGIHDELLVAMVRELLANVVRHAAATAARVSLVRVGERVRLDVSDNGRGVAAHALAAAAAAGHIGHQRLQEQVHALGGRIAIESEPGRRTLVTVEATVTALETQRRVGEVVRHGRQWSSALLAAVQDGLVVFRERRVVEVNDRFCAMTGYSRETLLAAPAGQTPFWPPELWGPRADVLSGLRSSDGIDIEVTLARADGTRFPALAAARMVRDDRGAAVAALVTVKDITARERAERRRRLERELEGARRSTRELGGILERARGVRSAADLQGLLDTIARVVCDEFGWAVAVNVLRPAWGDLAVRAVHGLGDEGARMLAGATYPLSAWQPVLTERFARRGAYFVPAGPETAALLAGGPTFVPDLPVSDDPGVWHPMDMLLVPITRRDGARVGLLSLDVPRHGRRPDDAELDLLTAVGAHIGVALEAVQETRAAHQRDRVQRTLADLFVGASGPPQAGRLDEVLGALTRVLAYDRVVLDVVAHHGRTFDRAAAVGVDDDELAPSFVLGPAALAALVDDATWRAGHRLLAHDQALALLPAERAALAFSRSNGEGEEAWRDHLLVLPVAGRGDAPAALLWVQDPRDRLLPARGRLHALRAFSGLLGIALAASAAG
ncbi:PAS domain S-box protein [Paraconexibacter antarcticus]|uniref:PAS domain S-box protein n=1 Tax=Paraconexibacter antarcticus TaxID=2949664 RepID=A0ABY5DRW4_9ACTN|nr:PAS domain S-box protein [Paraconexibacter antarcticus]UTI63557.1 PAS domain S-box protein [Paraconexibacter antarcticus]